MNCTIGTVDVSKFSKPMPIIGLYIAGATLFCVMQMVRDLVSAFRSKMSWIPAEHFSADAVTLTVVGVAIKLSVDLNSAMPSQVDQLAKLSTSAFICTMLVSTTPSLGKLEKGEVQANTTAFAILVITSVVNLCIQLNTGVIQAFRKAHIFLITMMCVLLYLYILVAASLPGNKNRSQVKFERLHQQLLKESFGDSNKNEKVSKKMKDYLEKFSMMAQSGCPHLMLCRSSPSYAVIFCGSMPAAALLFVLLATIIHKGKMVGLIACSGESDYGWSVLVILITQVIAVVVGLVAPVHRGRSFFNASNFSSPQREEDSGEIKNFWMRPPYRKREDLHFPYIQDRLRSPFLYGMKVRLVEAGISVQLLVSAIFNSFTVSMVKNSQHAGSNNFNQKSINLRPYILNSVLGIDSMVLFSSRVTQNFLDNAKKSEPEQLIDFLKHHLSNDFEGVYRFEGTSEGPPDGWSLQLLTLTCIAIALPKIGHTLKKRLVENIIEGLVYVKLVEDNLNVVHDLENILPAANLLWKYLDGDRRRWFDIDLEILSSSNTSPRDVLTSLAKSAKEKISEMANDQKRDNRYTYWKQLLVTPSKGYVGEAALWGAVAAHSMHKICQSLLQDCQNEENDDLLSHKIYEKLCNTIADILGACFTNLRQYILLECKRSTIEKRRETVFRMLKLFGETERIMEILEENGRKIPEFSDNHEMAFIEGWRAWRRSNPTRRQTEELSRTQRDDWTNEQPRTQKDDLADIV